MRKLLFSLSICVLGACSYQDASLADLVVLKPLVPEKLVHITPNDKVVAWMTAPNQAVGIAGTSYFETTDGFNSIDTAKGSFVGNLIYHEGQDLITVDAKPYEDLYIYENNEGGKGGFKVKTIKKAKSNPSDQAYHYFQGVSFISKDKGFVFSFYNSEQPKIVVYHVNGHNIIQISTLSGEYFPVAAHFDDEKNGYLVVNRYHSSIPSEDAQYSFFKTKDGGLNWTGPFFITNEVAVKDLKVLKDGTMYVYGKRGLAFSKDNGLNWKVVNHSGFLSDLQFMRDGSIMAAQQTGIDLKSDYPTGKIMISRDNGNTWEQINEKPVFLDQIYFYDRLNGLAMTHGVLQLTNDGGVTWQLITYPVNKSKYDKN